MTGGTPTARQQSFNSLFEMHEELYGDDPNCVCEGFNSLFEMQSHATRTALCIFRFNSLFEMPRHQVRVEAPFFIRFQFSV